MDATTPKPPDQYDVESLVAECVSYHKPTDLQVAQIGEIREGTKALILAIVKYCPSGPDRSAAIRKAREAMMTANAAIMVPLGATKF